VNFDYNEEQRLLAASIRRFAEKDYGFDARKKIVAGPEGWSRAVWSTLAELGVLGLPLPAEFGGFGGGAVDLVSVMEMIGEALVVEPFLATVGLGARFVARGGTAMQQARLLPAVAGGELILAFAHTERGARDDLARIAMRARRTSEGYVLDGDKRVVLHAPCAQRLIVSARTQGEPAQARGISLFFVDAGAPVVNMRRYRTIDDEPPAADVSLQAVKVGADALIGAEHEGLALIEEVVDYATALVCAEAVGAIKYANDATLEYLKTRKQFGVPIGSFQALQHRTVDMVDRPRAGEVDGEPSLRRRRRRARTRAAQAHGVGGQGEDRGRLPSGEPGVGSASRRHGHERRDEDKPLRFAAHDDRAAVRRRGSSSGALSHARHEPAAARERRRDR
jgi:alkylation response protein AidB-like acyl-CoA dehydrogenase